MCKGLINVQMIKIFRNSYRDKDAILVIVFSPAWTGIETRYGPGGPGIESWWGARFFTHVQNGPGPTQPSVQWVPGLFPGVKRPERGVDHPLHLAQRLKKSRATALLPFWDFVACSGVKFAFNSHQLCANPRQTVFYVSYFG